MKVGIITTHDVYNFGSSLQAYATQRFLDEHGIEAKIIDYVPSNLYKLIDFFEVDAPRWNTNMWRKNIYRLRMVPYRISFLPKYLKYKNFNNKFLKLTRRCKTINDLKNLEEYDAYICGSDQIWNPIHTPCGLDPAYYLAFAPEGKKRVSYAASFGGSQINEAGERNIKEFLPLMHNVSVREQSGVSILNDLGIKSQLVLDPVFLLNKTAWGKLKHLKYQLPEKYVLVYGYDNKYDLKDIVEKCGYKDITIVDLLDAKYKNLGPREFISLVEDAEFIVTSSFHCIAFSIILHKNFIAVKTGNEDLFERLSNIMSITGQEDRIYNENRNTSELGEIDYEAVDARLEPYIERSKKYLIESITGEKYENRAL